MEDKSVIDRIVAKRVGECIAVDSVGVKDIILRGT